MPPSHPSPDSQSETPLHAAESLHHPFAGEAEIYGEMHFDLVEIQ